MASDPPSYERLAHCLRHRRRPFTRGFDFGIGSSERGVYAFWLRSSCLYVGMSTHLRQRIYQHRMQEHNELLSRYFKAFWSDIEASFVPLSGQSEAALRSTEQAVIRMLRPRTNRQHAK